MSKTTSNPFDNYYYLKNEYNTAKASVVKKIAKNKSIPRKMKHKYYLKKKNKLPNKEFTNKDRVLVYKDNTHTKLEINHSYFNLYEKSINAFSLWDDENKKNIMKLKLDIMFNYVDEIEGMKRFELIKEELNDDSNAYNDLVYTMHKSINKNKDKIDEVKKELYDEGGYIETLKQLIHTNDKLGAAELYVNSIQPNIKKLSNLQYPGRELIWADRIYFDKFLQIYEVRLPDTNIIDIEFENQAGDDDGSVDKQNSDDTLSKDTDKDKSTGVIIKPEDDEDTVGDIDDLDEKEYQINIGD